MIKASATGSSSTRAQVASACQSCRASKVKCSGKHPTCGRCSSRGSQCVYDVLEEGMTKRQQLRQEYEDQGSKLEICRTILNVLRGGSDVDATETLARLRMGQTLEDVHDDIVRMQERRGQGLSNVQLLMDEDERPEGDAPMQHALHLTAHPSGLGKPSRGSPQKLAIASRPVPTAQSIRQETEHPHQMEYQQQQGEPSRLMETQHMHWAPLEAQYTVPASIHASYELLDPSESGIEDSGYLN